MKNFVLASAMLAGLALATPTPMVGPPACYPQTESDGNGDPQQMYQFLQVSDNITCGSEEGDTCDVAHSESKTVDYGVSGSIAQWISAGFSVSESYTTGNTYGCNANPGQTACVFDKIAYTAYHVITYDENDTCQTPGPKAVITSPNNNNAGGGYTCMYDNDCHEIGYSYWQAGAAGGPPN